MSLPTPTVTFSDTDLDPDDKTLKGMFCNPVYAGVAPYRSLLSDEEWIESALDQIEEDGAEQFLVNMLYVLRMSMLAAFPKARETVIGLDRKPSRRRH